MLKHFKKISTCLIAMICLGFIAKAQETIFDEVSVPYKKELLGGFTLHNNGWGLNFAKGKYLSDSKKRMLGIEIVGMKSPKEIKLPNFQFDGSRPYVFGKLNTFTIVRPSFGYKKVLFDKIRKSGVEISFEYGAGPSIGLVKPVYLEIRVSDNITGFRLETEKYDPERHYNVGGNSNIYGRASSLLGLGEMKIHPGGFVKAAFNFEYSSEKAGIKALETGLIADLYPEKIPIMAFEQNTNFFFAFYAKLMFGKKFIQ